MVPGVKVSLTGPDVSLNQPDVDWAQVAGAGHTFAIAKVTDGLGTRDPKFGKGRWKAMKDAGLVRGAYHFARPQKGRDPKDEVAEYLACVADAGGLQPETSCRCSTSRRTARPASSPRRRRSSGCAAG